jgi:hypothetical protein
MLQAQTNRADGLKANITDVEDRDNRPLNIAKPLALAFPKSLRSMLEDR